MSWRGAKRKIEEEHTYEKRLRAAYLLSIGSRVPALGTQDYPFEIESTPEPEESEEAEESEEPEQEQDTSLPRSQLPVKQWGLQVDTSRGPPYYAIAGGHVPGIYTGPYEFIQMAQLKGYRGNRHRKFHTLDDAWGYLESMRDVVDQALNCERGRAYLASIQKPPSAKPQPRRSTSNAQHTSSLPSSSYTQARAHYSHHPAMLEGGHESLPSSSYTQAQAHYSHHPAMLKSGHESLPSQTPSQSPIPSPDDLQPNMNNNNIAAESEVTLDLEQQHVVNLIMAGHNVFYTGPAGCGKSAILRVFKRRLEEQNKTVFVTAPTNLAALAVGGRTTYSYAGWHMDTGKEPLHVLKGKVRKGKQKELFENTDVLVIDEISMVEHNFFGRLNEVMKFARGSDKAFGGVQVIVTGDFCQLAPVKPFMNCFSCGSETEPDTMRNENPSEYECPNRKCRRLFYDVDKWAFRSEAWKECEFVNINLTRIHRQDDPQFRHILNQIRLEGIVRPEHKEILLNHESETEGAIQIFTHKWLVSKLNKKKISELPGAAIQYRCKDFFLWKEHHRSDRSMEKFTRKDSAGQLHNLSDHRYEAELEFKMYMRVVLLHNLAPALGLVNGSQGIIVGMESYDPEKLPTKNHPLTGPHARYCEEEIKRFSERNLFRPWPVVRFDNGLTKTIYADCSAAERGSNAPFSLLSRTQIPLMAGWGVTIHRAQGMSLDKVKVDLANAFETQQSYVALSRARSLRGLTVLSLPSGGLGGQNTEVKEFLATFC